METRLCETDLRWQEKNQRHFKETLLFSDTGIVLLILFGNDRGWQTYM